MRCSRQGHGWEFRQKCCVHEGKSISRMTIKDPDPTLSSTPSPGFTCARKTLVTSETHLTLVHATNTYLAPSVCQMLFEVLENDSPCFDRTPET